MILKSVESKIFISRRGHHKGQSQWLVFENIKFSSRCASTRFDSNPFTCTTGQSSFVFVYNCSGRKRTNDLTLTGYSIVNKYFLKCIWLITADNQMVWISMWFQDGCGIHQGWIILKSSLVFSPVRNREEFWMTTHRDQMKVYSPMDNLNKTSFIADRQSEEKFDRLPSEVWVWVGGSSRSLLSIIVESKCRSLHSVSRTDKQSCVVTTMFQWIAAAPRWIDRC